MKTLFTLFTVFSLGVVIAQTNCSQIFISEYVEGWSNNKALEIYNPTSAPVNLSQFFVARYSNGSSTATVGNAIQLSGTIAPHSVYVAVLQKLDPLGVGQEAPVWDSLQSRADGFYCPDYAVSNCFYWNGNDAVMLAKGTLPTDPTLLINPTNVPNFAIMDIFGKIGEKVVLHQARKYGETKFGMERFINGFLDLITIWFLSRFGKRPMHLFGALGSIMFLIGFLSAGFIGFLKLYKLYHGMPYELVTNNPWFYISLTTMIIGTQLFLAGFLGEIILRTKNNEERYKISKELS